MTAPPESLGTEADLVAVFCASVEASNANPNLKAPKWTIYHETAGWDVLLVDDDGVQIGVEAKLSVNAKVLCQALPTLGYETAGPDFRAILVPDRKCVSGMADLAGHLGLTIIRVSVSTDPYNKGRVTVQPWGLPVPNDAWNMRQWFHWLPSKRCALPKYIPDVVGGKPSPVALTDWKVKAIKLLVLLDRNGFVTRTDMRRLGISESRWTAASFGYLSPDPIKGGYVRNNHTPDLRSQHPVNYAQIEADIGDWWEARKAA